MLIVLIGWVFFSFPYLESALNYLAVMFGFVNNDIVTFSIAYFLNIKMIVWLIIAIGLSTPLIPNLLKKYNSNKYFEIIKTIFLGFLLILCILFIVNSTYSPFIYFQF